MNKLGEYILTALRAEHISQKELADGVHVSPAQISRIINGIRGADVVTIGKIAFYLRRRPEELFRVAGHLPPISSKSALVERIEYRISTLPEEEQQDLEAYVEMRHRIIEERGKHESKEKKSKPSRL